MTIFNRLPVAVAIMLSVILLCCVLGYSRSSEPLAEIEETVSVSDGRQAGKSSLNYYMEWLQDDADLFTMDTADTIARRNFILDTTYNSIVAIHTITSLDGKGIEEYTRDEAERMKEQEMELTGRDMLLLLDTETQNWFLLYGSGLNEYADRETLSGQDLQALLEDQLTVDFFESGSNQKVIFLFNALEDWFANHVPSVEEDGSLQAGGRAQAATFHDIFTGVLFTLLTNIWWIVLLLVILSLLDRARVTRYVTAHPDGYDPADPFKPLLFWHHADSTWYADMWELLDDEDAWYEDELGET